MKKKYLFLFLFSHLFCFAQVYEDFSDGNFTENPSWIGTSENFKVNTSFELQSSTNKTSKSFLFTPSEAFDDAIWECHIKINCPNTASNFARIYLTSDRTDSILNCNAYYVQIGGSNKNISLNRQESNKTNPSRIITGAKNRLKLDSVTINIKVTRDKKGNFLLYSQLSGEEEFLLEGEKNDTKILSANYFGLMFSNTTATGEAYYFDSIRVSGEKVLDTIPPEWESWSIEGKNKLIVSFSKPMNFDNAAFHIGQLEKEINISPDKYSISFSFSEPLKEGIVYLLQSKNLTDLSNNSLYELNLEFGFSETAEEGDVVFNELMFDPNESSYEYIEVYNKSAKILDASELFFAVQKTDGSLYPPVSLSKKILLAPKSYLAISTDANTVKAYHNCPEESRIISVQSWKTLPNEEGSIVITDKDKIIIYDALSYSKKWHHPLIFSERGVALERISPLLPTQTADSWHSAASTVNYGTPGYKNSQYREINASTDTKKIVWVEPEAFSPDNDGENDVCFIHYKTEEAGYIGNITIFNASGVKVKQLASNSLLESEGSFLWNGKNEKEETVNTGIYLLFFELFHPQNGKKKQIKLPIVVSTK